MSFVVIGFGLAKPHTQNSGPYYISLGMWVGVVYGKVPMER